MFKVRPDRVELIENKRGTRLILVGKDSKNAFQLEMSLKTGQELELEINGLAADRCGRHHIGAAIARACGMKVGFLLLSYLHDGWMAAELMLESDDDDADIMQTKRVRVDVTAALEMAIHTNVPIWVDDNHTRSHGPRHLNAAAEGHTSPAKIPPAFHRAIESMEWPGEDVS